MQERIFHNGVVPIDNISLNQSIHRIDSILENGEKDQQVITLSPKCYLFAFTNEEFRGVLNNASLVIPESSLLRNYSFINPPVLVRVTGIDLLTQILNECNVRRLRVALLGSVETNRNKAQQNLERKYPNLNVETVQGKYSFLDDGDSKMIVQSLHNLSPHFIVVAGNQVESEMWINRWLLGSNLGLNLVGNFGQAIDLFAGVRKDHKLARKIGFEWVMRMLSGSGEFRKERFNTFVAFSEMFLFGKSNKNR